MPDQRIESDPAKEDAICERAVLAVILSEHPTHLTVLELAREFAGPEDFGEGDAVERAVRDLTGVGLLQCHGGYVAPTRAALRANELWGEAS